MATLFGMFPFLKTLFADGGYQGPQFAKAVSKVLPYLDVEIVKRDCPQLPQTHDFGRAYGVLIKDMGLLARTIFVIGPDGRIRYIQRVHDITQEPDYAAALFAARAAK